MAAVFVPLSTANAADPTYGGFSIDGVVPDAGFTAYPDPFGAADELGPENGSPQQLVKIHTAPKPMLAETNPNDQTDLKNVWLETATQTDGTWLYFAWERLLNNGSGVIMFEFQKAARPVACAYDTATEAELIENCNPWENRQAGDFIIVWDWSGSSTTIVKRTFETKSDGSLVLGDDVVLSDTAAKARYSPDLFRGEAAVNLSATVFPPSPTSCLTIANVLPFTGTGNSPTADLKDMVLNAFEGTHISNCGSVEVTKEANAEGSFEVTLDRTSGADINYDDETSASLTLATDETDSFVDIIPGTDFRLAETAQPGWELVSIVCDGQDVTAGEAFSVTAGEVTECTVTNFEAQPSIAVDKSADPDSELLLDDDVLYTVTVENTGNVDLTDVTVTDPLCTPVYVSGDDGDDVLQVDETWTYECTYEISQDDVDAGSVSNTADGSAYYGDTEVTDDGTAVVTTLQEPSIAVDKTADPDADLVVGDDVLYTVTVENDGNVTLSDVTVTDPLCTPVYLSGDDGDELLQVDEVWTYTCTYAITQADVDAGSVTNTADGSAFFGDTEVTDDGTAVVTTLQNPAIAVDKTASPDEDLELDDAVLYTVTVENSGDVTLSDVTVTDPLCTPVYLSGDDGDELLQVDEVWTYTCTYAITQADVDAGSVSNTADGLAFFGDTEVTDDGTAVVTTLQDPSIAVDKSADPSSGLALGDPVVYTVTVENDGNVTLSDVTVTDPLCTPVYVSGDDGDELLQVDEVWTYECTYEITQADVDAGSVTNTADGSAFFGDTEVTDDGTAVVTIPQGPSILVDKSAEPTSGLALGDEVVYTVTVDNDGNVTLSDVTVTDPLCTPVYLSGDDGDELLQVDEVWTYTCTYVITQVDVDAGSVVNTADGSAFFGDTEVTDDGTAVVTTLQNPAISVDKTASPDGDLELDDAVLYTVTVENSGDVTLSDVTVTDPLCTPVYLSGDDGDELLQVGEVWTYTCTYAITQADVDAGSVTNTADGSAFFGDTEVTDDGTAVVTTLQDPSIAVDKSASPDENLEL
ncbi:MAG: hypothetical protein ACLGIG_05210, partial [Actinomycetes bacterium]